MRLKMLPRPPSSVEDELSSIEGPIVDTTQPAEVDQSNDTPSSLDLLPTADLVGMNYTIDDEPLFEQGTFSVNPVESELPDDTVNDEAPAALELEALRRAMGGSAPTIDQHGKTDPGEIVPTDAPAPAAPKVEAPKKPTRPEFKPRAPITELPRKEAPVAPPDTLLNALAVAPEAPPEDILSSPAPDLPYLKRFKRSSVPSESELPATLPALAVEAPRVKASRVLLALMAALLLLGLVLGLGYLARYPLSAWLETSPAEGQSKVSTARSTDEN
jgi:hypothetical protein